MTNQHPIVPPPDLVGNWLSKHYGINHEDVAERDCDLITRAVQWGADQELEACCAELDKVNGGYWSAQLRTARRPKPPSLKEQALAMLDDTEVDAIHYDTIRRALEALPDD